MLKTDKKDADDDDNEKRIFDNLFFVLLCGVLHGVQDQIVSQPITATV